MSTVTIAVDLAKNVFELAIAGRAGTIRQRESRARSSNSSGAHVRLAAS